METALITWIIIAAFAVAILIYDIFHRSSRINSLHASKYSHFIESGKEIDEVFIPGDINSSHDSDIIEYDEELV